MSAKAGLGLGEILEAQGLLRLNEGPGFAASPRARSPTDAVDVLGKVGRRVKIDDMADFGKVNPTGRNVGTNQPACQT